MHFYIICYDLESAIRKDYEEMERKINALNSGWPGWRLGMPERFPKPKKYQWTTWVVQTNRTAGSVYRFLRGGMAPRDKLLVSEIIDIKTSHRGKRRGVLGEWLPDFLDPNLP